MFLMTERNVLQKSSSSGHAHPEGQRGPLNGGDAVKTKQTFVVPVSETRSGSENQQSSTSARVSLAHAHGAADEELGLATCEDLAEAVPLASKVVGVVGDGRVCPLAPSKVIVLTASQTEFKGTHTSASHSPPSDPRPQTSRSASSSSGH